MLSFGRTFPYGKLNLIETGQYKLFMLYFLPGRQERPDGHANSLISLTLNSATSQGRATNILRKRTIMLPIASAFALTLAQPLAAYASGTEVITERAITYTYTSAETFTSGQSPRVNGFSSAALSPQYLPDADALPGASAYRLSYAGTALMPPGASKTVKYVEPEPEPEPEPVVEETPAEIRVAVAAPAPHSNTCTSADPGP